MELQVKNYIILCVVSLLLGAGLAYKLTSPRIETIEKIVERVVTIRETVKPDGTIIKEVITKDKEKQKQVVASLPKNKVNLSYTRSNVYGLEYQRRIAGPVFIGASVNSEGVLGISIGLEF